MQTNLDELNKIKLMYFSVLCR